MNEIETVRRIYAGPGGATFALELGGAEARVSSRTAKVVLEKQSKQCRILKQHQHQKTPPPTTTIHTQPRSWLFEKASKINKPLAKPAGGGGNNLRKLETRGVLLKQTSIQSRT